MIGYLVLDKGYVPMIGIPYTISRGEIIVTRFVRPMGKRWNIYKVEFELDTPQLYCVGYGYGYRAQKFTVLELV